MSHQHDESAEAIKQSELDKDQNYIGNILNARLSRRQAIMGGVSAATTAIFSGVGLSGCSDNAGPIPTSTPAGPSMGFTAVSKSLADRVTVPQGYTASVLYALGDPLNASTLPWSGTGSETGASYAFRAGDHHDGMYYFGLNNAASAADFGGSMGGNSRGILAMNHEAPNPFNTGTGANALYVHANGASVTVADADAPHTGKLARRTVADEVVKEINHHGVSVIEVEKTGSSWSVNRSSTFNRRVTGATIIEISGPLRGTPEMITKFSPTGTQTQGTVNNCANGFTPWGTYLTCEENWAGYFARGAADNAMRTRTNEVTSLARYGNGQNGRQRLNWNTAGTSDDFQRWDTSVKAATADLDFRNVINHFGYTVEIDPYNPAAVPRKRTAMGRMAKEGAWPAPFVAGRPVVFYQGDDNRGDYVYKYVSNTNWDPADATAAAILATDRMAIGSKYLDNGKLFVARFNADGTGTWLLLADTATASAARLIEVFLDTRLAADAAGATRMDRPEWAAVNPRTGEVYLTLTNNNATLRTVTGTPTGNAALTDAANPRHYNDPTLTATAQRGNPNGHIIRWREAGDNASATTFSWDIYLFGARASQTDLNNINISRLETDNDFSSPDGAWFSRPGNPADGILWIQTDDGAYTDVTNCMMLAAVPGTVGDGTAMMVTGTDAVGNTRSVQTFAGKPATTSTVRRFLVGPKECEITGIDSTPDGKTLFVNIQHPGEVSSADFANPATFVSHWPAGSNASIDGSTNAAARPRSATIVITKDDGGVIGL